jgi:phenylpyruvate tautomerase PptA (4-oxalocrotonate tautomerase family)
MAPDAEAYAEQQAELVKELVEALLRNRQGYVNILEMRKLSSEQRGQRDGYGGRYGALTREEIEAVIAEIDEALAHVSKKDQSATEPQSQVLTQAEGSVDNKKRIE